MRKKTTIKEAITIDDENKDAWNWIKGRKYLQYISIASMKSISWRRGSWINKRYKEKRKTTTNTNTRIHSEKREGKKFIWEREEVLIKK